MRKWKEYVNYDCVKRKLQYSFYSDSQYKPKYEEFPGPISNSNVITPMDKFLNDGDPHNPDNLIVSNGQNLRNEIRLVSKNMWEFFLKNYGGGPEILKKMIEEKGNSSSYSNKVIEVFFRKV